MSLFVFSQSHSYYFTEMCNSSRFVQDFKKSLHLMHRGALIIFVQTLPHKIGITFHFVLKLTPVVLRNFSIGKMTGKLKKKNSYDICMYSFYVILSPWQNALTTKFHGGRKITYFLWIFQQRRNNIWIFLFCKRSKLLGFVKILTIDTIAVRWFNR